MSSTLVYTAQRPGNNAIGAHRMMAAARKAEADRAHYTRVCRESLRFIADARRAGHMSAEDAAENVSEILAHYSKFGVDVDALA